MSGAEVLRSFAVVCAISLTLCGCNDQMSGLAVSVAQPDLRPKAPANGISPRAASVAFASFDGLPGTFAQRFEAQLNSQAAAREITVSASAGAAYLVRGYLNVRNGEDGVSVGYVWDLFDHNRHRVQRVEDALIIGKANADPTSDLWALVDDRVLQTIAARSTDDLAAFLSTTPEASDPKAVARGPASPVAALEPSTSTSPSGASSAKSATTLALAAH